MDLPPPLRTTTIHPGLATLFPLELDRGSMDLLHRFKHRTLPALGIPNIMSLYEKELFRLAYFVSLRQYHIQSFILLSIPKPASGLC